MFLDPRTAGRHIATAGRHEQVKRVSRPRRSAAASLMLAAVIALPLSSAVRAQSTVHAGSAPVLQFTSVDTMKESMDTGRYQLKSSDIAADVNLAASLNPSYITVDTHFDYAPYMQQWVNAVRATGKHVWFRIHPNQWENSNNVTGMMTPSAYEAAEQAFISGNPNLFRSGDILDPCPEPENGPYWKATYGNSWTAGAPNAATDAFNAFVKDTSTVADTALHNAGIYGVITTVRSMNSWFAATPQALYPATVAFMGRVTIDSYPDQDTTDPATAVTNRLAELAQIYAVRGVPIVIGEMGYSNHIQVDDATQNTVLKAEFNAMATVPYLSGVNYWVGAGTSNSGGYTHIFNGTTGAWTARPAAAAVSAFYTAYGSGSQNPPPATATMTPVPPTATMTPVPPTATSTAVPPTATSTAVPPTATSTAVLPTATSTSVLPTATAIPASPTATMPGGTMSGWSSSDIGHVTAAGSHMTAGTAWTIQGSGDDIYGTADGFHFAWQPLVGNGSIGAHLLSQTYKTPWAKAGVMFRTSNSPGSPFYAALVTPGHGYFVEYRATQGGNVARGNIVNGTTPVYLKVTRAGQSFSAYGSTNGSTWTLIPGSTTTMTLPASVLRGLAVTSHIAGTVSVVTVNGVTL